MIVNSSGKNFECGIDEAGRGSFFGRLYVGAVIFPIDVELDASLVKDSKMFYSHNRRKQARDYVLEKCLYSNVAFVDSSDIDKNGIIPSLMGAMHSAIEGLEVQPEHILVDGDRFEQYKQIPYDLKIKGDSHYYSIAAASILAKVAHDEHILSMLTEHPELEEYGLRTNMGYGTKIHRDALQKKGCSEFHRKTFCEKTLGTRKPTVIGECLI